MSAAVQRLVDPSAMLIPSNNAICRIPNIVRPFTRKPHFGKPGRALYLLLVVLAINGVLIPQRLSAAIACVQGNYATPQTPQATVQVTYTNAQLAGDLNVVIVGWNDTSAVVSSVSDTKGNTYQLAVGPTLLSGA